MFLPNYCFEGLRQKLPHLNYSSSDFLSLCMEQQVFSEQRESQRMEKWEGMSMRVSCFEPSPQKRPRREESGGGGGGGDDDVEVQWIQAQVPVNIPKVQKPGTRYNIEEERLEIVEDQIEEDREREVDEITMKVFGDIANTMF